jgi:hypothetical protein
MYAAWEAGVQAWAATNGIVATEKPPTEYDDVHLPSNPTPSVSWVSPNEGGAVDGRTVTLEANASSGRGISRVEFGVDGQYLGRATNSPYRLTVTVPGSLERGFHTFTATAFDDVDDNASATVNVNVNASPTGPAARWESPSNGAAIPSFPVPLAIGIGVPDVVTVNFLAQKDGGPIITVGAAVPADGRASTPWQSRPTALGTYMLWPQLVHGDGSTEPGDKISVLVQ